MSHITVADPNLLTGGEMHVLLGCQDWSTSPLGAIDTWPQSLTSLVDVVLSSRFPMFLLWGATRTVIYNDAYIPVLGMKHPAALGQNFFELWPEVQELIKPVIDQAYDGQASLFEDLPVVLHRNGHPEQTYFTFSYSPARNDAGDVAGALCILHETTKKVSAERRLEFLIRLTDRLRGLEGPQDVISAAAEMLGLYLNVSRVGYGDVDESTRFFTTPSNWTDGTVASHVGTHDLAAFGRQIHDALRCSEALVVHDVATDPRITGSEASAAFAFLQTRAAVTVSLIKHGQMTAALYVHNREPRRWTEDEVRLIQDVAERTWDAVGRARSEVELRRSEALKGAILDAALDCIITVTGESRVVEWNSAAERTFGYSASQALGQDLARLIIPPEYRNSHQRGVAHYLATGYGPVLGNRIELEAIRANGSRFPIELAITPTDVHGQPHFTAYLRDITERKRSEAALRENEQRLRATYESAFAGIAEVDEDGRFIRVNEELCRITGYTREEMQRLSVRDITLPEDLWRDMEQFKRQMADDIGSYQMEKRFIHKDGEPRWVDLSASRVDDENGRPLYGVRVVRDISERKRAEEHRELLINELNHRVKNTLATVLSLTSQTLRTAATPVEAKDALEARLIALSRAHDVLTRENWEAANLHEIVAQAVAPFRVLKENRIAFAGPSLRIEPRTALAIAMALQELATNAMKYGALSNQTGEVGIRWIVEHHPAPARLRLTWEETGGPHVQEPTRRGFGVRLIERSLAQDLHGAARIEFAPTGVICRVETPLVDTQESQLPNLKAG